MREIYAKYKERLIELNGKNHNFFTTLSAKGTDCDLGVPLKSYDSNEFFNFLWNGGEFELDFSELTSSDVMAFTELTRIKKLCRETEETKRETGKCDLFIGFPFVFGVTSKGSKIKAPILLFPVTISADGKKALLSRSADIPVSMNESLLKALSNDNGLDSTELTKNFFAYGEYETLDDVIDCFNEYGCRFVRTKTQKIIPFNQIKSPTKGLCLKNAAVIGRFSVSNPIYDDYCVMEKYDLSTPNIDLLLKGKPLKERKNKKPTEIFAINSLDYTQNYAIKKAAELPNMVIYGPPGTGKSQTIVNVIGDALCKGKKILVVSQKQAALEVVFSRLGKLNSKAMFISDAEKDKSLFYDKLALAHSKAEETRSTEKFFDEYEKINDELKRENSSLDEIRKTLYSNTDFGINLQNMYEKSYNVGKDTVDYELLVKLKNTPIAEYEYHRLKAAVDEIKSKNLISIYSTYKNYLEKNPIANRLKCGSDIHTLKTCKKLIEDLNLSDFSGTVADDLRYFRYASAFLFDKNVNPDFSLAKIADLIMHAERYDLYRAKKLCLFPAFLPVFPLVATKYAKEKRKIVAKLEITANAIEVADKKFSALKNVLDEDGYALFIESVIRSHRDIIGLMRLALDEYPTINDMRLSIGSLNETVKTVLDFCYNNSVKTDLSAAAVLDKILSLRIYGEIVKNHSDSIPELKNLSRFNDIRKRISVLKTELHEVDKKIALNGNIDSYVNALACSKKAADYVYQFRKKRNLWQISKFMACFGDFVTELFPCWILSPQNVSALFPLKKDTFDVVIFDEASQIFIENAIPSIYRGKSVIVAGDNKQLKPSVGFMRRYSDEYSSDADLPTQAALEVVSLLDLAEAKYEPIRLNYHYRSDFSELIDFSNTAFYENKLQIAPNLFINVKEPPIERVFVKGIWRDRRNEEEAYAVVNLVKTLLQNRKNEETIGIVTFNSEQKDCIEELFEKESEKNSSFGKLLYKEQNRIESGENNSLFVKNLENVQGDERDIIIFSVGYAKNKYGKLNFQFGSLSTEGGENRLNVAVTRAKKKIYIVTGIEPEELTKADSAKNDGPKLLKKYLLYARAVSENNGSDLVNVLRSLRRGESHEENSTPYAEDVALFLEKSGYEVARNLGNAEYTLPLAVYAKSKERFLIGINFDYGVSSVKDESPTESFISKLDFWEKKGWKIVTVWSRDWWLSKNKVLDDLLKIIKKEEERVENSSSDAS